jgi:hypothetical protein
VTTKDTPVDAATTDINKVLTFGREKLARKMLPFGLIAAGVGLLSVLVGGDDAKLTYVGWGLIVFGIGFTWWCAMPRSYPVGDLPQSARQPQWDTTKR